MRTALLLSTSFLFVAGMAYAEEKAAPPPGPPAPAPQLAESMKAWVGNWKCTGKAFANPSSGQGQPERPIQGKLSVKPDLQNHWYVMRWDGTKTKQNPTPYSMMMAIGWAGDKLMSAAFDNSGAVTHSTSAGWKDNVMVWEGSSQMGPHKIGFRETMTQDKKVINSKVEMQGQDGKWFTGVEYSCKK